MTTDTTTPSNDTAPATPATAATQDKIESLLGQARSAIEGAVETTVDAVKEHPIAAAGIAAGAAAAVAGAAFGVSKLLEKDTPPAKTKR